MEKFSRKTKIIILLIIVTVFLGLGVGAIAKKKSDNCQNIIGDGYAMGTDPEPVVIGNTCDL